MAGADDVATPATPTRPLAGKVALVTGATSGIGEATALALAAAGASVMLCGRDARRASSLVQQVKDGGGRAVFFLADLRLAGAVDAMVDATVRTFGALDLAFNSAGIFDRGREFHTYTDAEWDDMLAVNLTTVFRCMRAEIAAMLTSGGGVVVNNASTVGHRGSDRASPAYVAAKHGVIGLTRQAALEYVGRGIRVNAVSPGPTLTPMTAPLQAEGPDAVRRAVGALNPTGRFVDPEDIARTVVFLCSDAASMINGHDIPLDGGQLAKL